MRKDRKWILYVVIALSVVITASTVSVVFSAPLAIRALLVHPRSTKEIPFYQQIIEDAKSHRFNVIFFEATGWIRYPSLSSVNLPFAFTPEQIVQLKQQAESSGMEVVPYVELLTHQVEVANRFQPSLMLNQSDADPENPRLWEFEKKLVDDTLSIYHPKMMLIGHDELWGYGKSNKVLEGLRAGGKRISPESFLKHIVRVHDYLKSKGVITIIWGDMFLMPSFSLGVYHIDGTEPSPGYNGTPEFEALLDRLPKDIVIIDWHYENKSVNYPSYDFFKRKGFTVWGASWHEKHNIQSFSDYVRARANQNEGMVATTWEFSNPKNADYLRRIIDLSANAFYGSK